MSSGPGSELAPGTPVHVDFRKWTDARTGETAEHWQEPASWLGADQYGSWLAMPTGTVSAKPTFQFVHSYPHVKLITDLGWTANISHPPTDRRRITIYVDMITRPVWTRAGLGWRVTMIDLDLDVIEFNDGSIMIDDEDEFADHRVRHHYPAEAIASAESACADVERMLRERDVRFRAVADRWLAHVGS